MRLCTLAVSELHPGSTDAGQLRVEPRSAAGARCPVTRKIARPAVALAAPVAPAVVDFGVTAAAASSRLAACAATLSVTWSATGSAAGSTPVRAMARKNRTSSRWCRPISRVAMPYSLGRASACALS